MREDKFVTLEELIEDKLIYEHVGDKPMLYTDYEASERKLKAWGIRNHRLFLRRFVCPVPVHGDEVSRLSTVLAMEQLELYVENAEKLLSLKQLDSVFGRLYRRLYNEFAVTMEAAPVTNFSSGKRITLYNVTVMEFVDDIPVYEFKKKIVTSIGNFEFMMRKGYIYGQGSSRVYGYTDILDYNLDDFNQGDVVVDHTGTCMWCMCMLLLLYVIAM